MDHCLSKLLAENKRLTDNVCNIARQDYEKVRTVGTIMAVKITGYLELIGIGGSASGAGLFLSLLRVQLAPKLGGGGGGHNLRYNAMEEEGRAAKYRWRILCTRCATMQGALFQKRSGYIHQNAFRRGPHRKCKSVTFNWNTRHLDRTKFDSCRWINCRASSIYGSVNNFNIYSTNFISFRSVAFSFSPAVLAQTSIHPRVLGLYFWRVYIKFFFVTTITSRAFGNDLFF